MKRFGINLNPFLYLNKYMPLSHFSIQHIISLAELENVDAFSMHYDSKYQLFTKREALLLNALSFKFINIHTSSNDHLYKDILDTKPNMVTFNGGLNETTFDTFSVRMSDTFEFFETATEWVKKSNILCGVKLLPDVAEIKYASKLQFDYIEFDLSELNSASNLDEEQHLLEKLKVAVIAAEKYGFGINISGLITPENMAQFQAICQVEEFYTSKHFFERSLIKGIVQTIHEYKK